MHPILEEINRCREIPRVQVLRRWQQQLRDVIAPLVAEGEAARQAQQDAAKAASTRKGRTS